METHSAAGGLIKEARAKHSRRARGPLSVAASLYSTPGVEAEGKPITYTGGIVSRPSRGASLLVAARASSALSAGNVTTRRNPRRWSRTRLHSFPLSPMRRQIAKSLQNTTSAKPENPSRFKSSEAKESPAITTDAPIPTDHKPRPNAQRGPKIKAGQQIPFFTARKPNSGCR
jgi:hypothetical protein